MVGQLASHQALPKDVIDSVTERTGGVPLFVEELTRLLLERGEQGGTQAIPPTLQQSLTARLDRLGPTREVAQIGAVIGRDFSYPMLRAVSGWEDPPLHAALDQLAEAGILLVQGLPPEADYRFKHALIADAAYENLLKSRRQVLHRRVAEVLRDQFAATASAQPELLAHHFTQANFIEAAIQWWGKAGQRSLERSALVEAVEQFKCALDQIAISPSTPALRREQIRLQVALITPLIHVKGYGAPETKTAVEQARLLIEQAEALGEPLDDPVLLFSVGVFTKGEASPTIFDEDHPVPLPASVFASPEVEIPAPLIDAFGGAMVRRVETETAVLKAGGVRGIAIRPGLVYGEGKGADLPNLIALARTHGAAPHLGAGGVRQGYVHIDDLVELYVQALERAPAGTMLPPCTSHIA
jgi:hypothetical protein